jgi:drug/metabolite transporter (DMT)-like permease
MNRKAGVGVYVAMFFAILFWGFSFIWSKQVLKVYSPISVIFIRLVLSVIFIFFFGKIFGKIQKIDKRDYKNMLFVAFFEPFAYFLGENFGLMHVSSTTAAVLIATIPLFSPIASYFVNNEKITFRSFLGILLSIVGVFLVILKPHMHFKADLPGVLLMLLAVFSAVGYSVIVHKVSHKYNVYTIIAYQNLIGVFLFLPLFLIFDFNIFINIKFSWTVWLPLFLLAIFASSFAFMLFTYGIKNLGVNRANTISNFIPIVTAFFSFLIMGEQFFWFNIFGILIVVGGLILSQIKNSDDALAKMEI